jgi:hypothetical protein
MSDKKTWVINYIPTEKERFTGNLVVNDDEILFETLYESSNKTIVTAIFVDVATFAAAGGHNVYRYSNDKTAYVKLPAADIAKVEATKKGFMKRAVVTMKNGEEFIFDYGMLKVTELVAAIEAIAGK